LHHTPDADDSGNGSVFFLICNQLPCSFEEKRSVFSVQSSAQPPEDEAANRSLA
jgi:hypothetical protein